MSNLDKLLKHEKKLPYSFVGTIIGLAGFIAAIYFSMFYEKAPKMDIEIMSQFSALDIKESVDSLDVIYNSNSLNAQGMSLSVIELKIVNSGTAPILRSYYDPESKAGFKVNRGVIPEPPIVETSKTSYAHNEISLEKADQNTIFLPHIIMNPQDFYTIKLIVLHDSKKKPTVQSFGVIAGFPKISVMQNLGSEDNRNLFDRFFDGSVLMNIGRFVVFGILFFIGIILIAIVFDKVSDINFNRRKRLLTEQFKKCNSRRLNAVPNGFFSHIEEASKYRLERYFKEISEDSSLAYNLYTKEFKVLGIIQKSEIGRIIVDKSVLEIFIELLHLFAEEKLINKPAIDRNIVEEKEETLEVAG
ncbi:hypothetical protein ND924_00120 [Vibrio diabolicus]|uniref:hypothetical protein n=1 Tax=Vibrio diabolicus TaxID=50719 RepID=UPI00215F95EF|nr:hypothetical protein [Vibrio diabolicus]MCS0301046.1 hypothetical protein [Vibrio diabolicus]